MVEQRVQFGVECPQCHWKHFMEVGIDTKLLKSPMYQEIKNQLEAWLRSRCPDHLGMIANLSRN